ncbi:MAG TPA: ATP-binding protein [Nitrososphaeraceae archaeon]|nr:ATP-binding protein [Nitrososphaeraceae archaeon]
MKPAEEVNSDSTSISSTLFTNFEGKFNARLSAVIPIHVTNTTENAPISAKYDCRVKAAYHKDLMGLLEEGMILAVKNFKAKLNDNNSDDSGNESERYTLLIASRIWPDHYGLRALSDQTYYPMQFEVIEQSVGDWDTDDKSTMMIQISAIPINYDLVVRDNGKYEYIKGFSYPLIGDQVFILNAQTVGDMYNKKVLDKVQWQSNIQHLSPSEVAHDSPRIGLIRMFENSREKIPIFVNFDYMVRYHFGLFSFTGGGKSNLLSNLLRKILLHTNDTKVVLFDISCEYPFLLMDLFANSSIDSKIVLERPVKDADQFYISVVKPREYEDDERVKKGLTKVFERGIVTHFVKPQFVTPTCKDIFDELDKLKSESIEKPHYIDAINDIRKKLIECMTQSKLLESSFIDQNFVQILSNTALEAIKTYKVNQNAGLHAWASSRDTLLGRIKPPRTDNSSNEDEDNNGITTDEIFNLIEGKSRLTCISISDPYTIKELVLNLTDQFLHRRKQQFKVKPYILFVFDEAQEFVADLTNSRGIDKECSQSVETLLRQGRKYGLGGCIATQRIAYLNTSALQQLHTYFVGTLPRPYDRNVVSNTFTIDQQILEKTLEFAPGEWLLSSYIATGIENVPIFIRADNSENEVAAFIEKSS